MPQVTGQIKAVRKDRKGIMVDDTWYSSYSPLPEGIAKGVVVDFEFTEKGTFKNIKGVPDITGQAPAPAQSSGTSAPAASATMAHYYNGLGFMAKQFPVPADHPDMSIIRQSCLKAAVDSLKGSEPLDLASVIEAADFFVGYCSGNSDEIA